jgi:hypothetical protein
MSVVSLSSLNPSLNGVAGATPTPVVGTGKALRAGGSGDGDTVDISGLGKQLSDKMKAASGATEDDQKSQDEAHIKALESRVKELQAQIQEIQSSNLPEDEKRKKLLELNAQLASLQGELADAQKQQAQSSGGSGGNGQTAMSAAGAKG